MEVNEQGSGLSEVRSEDVDEGAGQNEEVEDEEDELEEVVPPGPSMRSQKQDE